MAATLCGLGVAPSQARAAELGISAPRSVVAGQPCRVAVAVSRSVRGTALLQERAGSRWRTVATAPLKRRSVTLRCPTVNRAGQTRRLRALVRRNGRTVARSRTVAVRILRAPASTTPGAPPAGPRPPVPGPRPGAPATPLDPAQFGVEGTGGPPSPAALALLSNPNVVLDADGVADLRAGRIDPRIVAVLTKLSEANKITVSTMCSDHAKFVGGAVSNHYYGRAMDIAAIDGAPVTHANDVAHGVVDSLSSLDASYRPDEVGSPWATDAPGHFTDAAHQDKIHVGFEQPIDPWWTPPA